MSGLMLNISYCHCSRRRSEMVFMSSSFSESISFHKIVIVTIMTNIEKNVQINYFQRHVSALIILLN